jgi:L-cysteine S-thiosulfotransferase
VNVALRALCRLVAVLALGQCAQAADLNGREIAHDVFRGNCLACHQIPGDRGAVSLADIGPVLSHMRQRFPNRAMLRAQIWDSTVRNPLTVMPPFGRHKVLTEEEIDAVVDYIYQY